jgi:hypothetical protein
VAGNMTDDELERIWTEVVGVYPTYYPGICLEDLRKLMKTLRRGDVPSEVRIEHIRDIYLQTYRYANMFGLFTVTPSG